MNVIATLTPPAPQARLEIGKVGAWRDAPLYLDLERLLAGRLLVQGSSGAGKSSALRRIVEEAFEFITTHIVDPEGEFDNLAAHIGATTIRASELATDGLTAAAVRSRHHRLPIHLDLSGLDPEERITKASAFFAGLIECPREDWTHTVLVAIDEAHLLAPHAAASARDGEIRRLGVSTLTELCSRGRKRGIAPIIATQRLAKLSASVTSELHNALIGLNVLDRDIVRAAGFLGFTTEQAADLRRLLPGEFYALGPALTPRPVISKIGQSLTRHTGSTPDLVGPAEETGDAAGELLGLAALMESGATRAAPIQQRGGGRQMLDAFLMDPAAAAAARVIDALRSISPNATTAVQLSNHLGLDAAAIDKALDLLATLGAVDTMPRDDHRLARLSPRLRLRAAEIPVVGLS